VVQACGIGATVEIGQPSEGWPRGAAGICGFDPNYLENQFVRLRAARHGTDRRSAAMPGKTME
jgi:hypothetical protein